MNPSNVSHHFLPFFQFTAFDDVAGSDLPHIEIQPISEKSSTFSVGAIIGGYIKEEPIANIIQQYSDRLDKSMDWVKFVGSKVGAFSDVPENLFSQWRQFLNAAFEDVTSIRSLIITEWPPDECWTHLNECLLNSGKEIRSLDIDSELIGLGMVWETGRLEEAEYLEAYYEKITALLLLLKQNPDIERLIFYSDYDDVLWTNLMGAIQTFRSPLKIWFNRGDAHKLSVGTGELLEMDLHFDDTTGPIA